MANRKDWALEAFRSDDLIGIGMEADALRRKLHPDDVVTYVLERNIRYTNFSMESADSCAPDPTHGSEYAAERHHLNLNSINDAMGGSIEERIAESVEMGGTGVLLQGSLHPPGAKIEGFERLLQRIKRRFPGVWLHCFSAPEILAIAQSSALTVRDTLARLRDAGADSITGSGASILDRQVHPRTNPARCSAEDWAGVHRAAHSVGLRTTAAITFGDGESLEQRITHLERIRTIQEETGGFAAFIPSSLPPGNTVADSSKWEGATAVEYLKALAISRLYLDNVENIQSSRIPHGVKVLELGLRFGGNDAGSVMLESGGSSIGANRVTEEELRRVIRDAGFRPAQRDTLYTTFFLN